MRPKLSLNKLEEQSPPDLMDGRGAGINPANSYFKQELSTDHLEGIDEPLYLEKPKTELIKVFPKSILSKNSSPDLPYAYSINPYQGCEHGCAYCYARNSHEYWGYSAGLDFESKIIYKPNAAELLEKAFLNPNYKPEPIMLSGNTDCYQPLERKMGITRSLLKIFLKYRNPVSIITKNTLIKRDLDILEELASLKLLHIAFSITSLNEDIRSKLEPRTATAKTKLQTMELFASRGIPMAIMAAPMIPGLNDNELFPIFKQGAAHGASKAGYTVLRLNGHLESIFDVWLEKHFPERRQKILNQTREMHGGQLNDSQWGRRMRGEGKWAEMIKMQAELATKQFFKDKHWPDYNLNLFRKAGNYTLFGG